MVSREFGAGEPISTQTGTENERVSLVVGGMTCASLYTLTWRTR